jgi:hypothetical protein
MVNISGLSFPQNVQLLLDLHIWVADTGASVHSIGNGYRFWHAREYRGTNRVSHGNGRVLHVRKIGHIHEDVYNKYGADQGCIILHDIRWLPDQRYNLISMTQFTKKGWHTRNNEKSLWLISGNNFIVFDIEIPTSSSCVYAIYINLVAPDGQYQPDTTCIMCDDTGKKSMVMMAEQAHARFEHCREATTCSIAQQLGWILKPGALPM